MVPLFALLSKSFVDFLFFCFISIKLNFCHLLLLFVVKFYFIDICCRKISPSDVFIIALAATDIMFSLSIHPMLIATSFGANSYAIFTTTGQLYCGYNYICYPNIIYILLIFISADNWKIQRS